MQIGMRALLVGLLATATAAAQEAPMSATSGRPGNLFGPVQKVEFAIATGGDVVQYRVLGYSGEEVKAGEAPAAGGAATIRLGRLPRGHYRLICRSGNEEQTVAFGVMTNRSRGKPSVTGRIAVDGATAWLSQPDQWTPIARMLRMTGIGWVRERLSWGGVQPTPDAINWERYETVATAFADEKVRVYQIYHDSPGWTHPDRPRSRCPDDLRDVYRFAKAAGEHFRGRIFAWEPWNEPDIVPFFSDLADRYAGIQKAAYLGFRAGAADVPVLLCSLCAGPSQFAHNLYECGVADYYDIFNFHVYANPRDYPQIIKRYFDLVEQYGAGGRPAWLTECGIRLERVNGELSWENQRRQAEFVPQSVVKSLAAGVDRHFFFVLPHYEEGRTQFGALHKDLSPRPAFIALATAVELLGEARYVGAVEAGEGVEAHEFAAKGRRVVAVWADESEREARITGRGEVMVVGMLGSRRAAKAERGALTLAVGPAAQYVVGGRPSSRGSAGNGAPPGPGTAHPVVMAGHCELEVDKGGNFYKAKPGPVSLTADVYNLSEQGEAANVLLTAEDDGGWQAAPKVARLRVAPMERKTIQFLVTAAADDKLHKIWVRGTADGDEIAPTVSYVRCGAEG